MRGCFAAVAQLVERNLAKVEVESSRLFCRSSFLGESNCFPPFNFKSVQVLRGAMAEWLCSGLQSRVPRFDSGSRLQNKLLNIDRKARYCGLFCCRSLGWLSRQNMVKRGTCHPGKVANHPSTIQFAVYANVYKAPPCFFLGICRQAQRAAVTPNFAYFHRRKGRRFVRRTARVLT